MPWIRALCGPGRAAGEHVVALRTRPVRGEEFAATLRARLERDARLPRTGDPMA
ncbi:hypothetical protein ACWCXC_26845 [Streptomyces sp. NPDC001515]